MPAYLDFNASAPVDERVLSYMIDIYRNHYGNADSRTHIFGTEAKEIVAASRKTIANILGIDSTELLFTSGSTESNNMAILGLIDYARRTGKTHFITTAIEHKSILESMKYLESLGFKVDYVSPDESGRIRVNQILDLITEKTILVSMMHVNSETGIIQPIKELGEALSQKSVFYHIDATQGFGKLNDELRDTKYDLMSFTAHKIGGPQGIGALVLRRNKRTYKRPPIKPLLYGGPQERGYRPGTTPVALVAGFARAAELCNDEAEEHLEACQKIKDKIIDSIRCLNYKINGDQRYCLPNTLNVSFTGVDAEGIFLALKDSYAFSNGSACNSGSHKPSYVLSAMGLDYERINEAIRISWNYDCNYNFSKLVDYIKDVS